MLAYVEWTYLHLKLTVDSGCIDLSLFQEEFEDTKVVIRIRKSKKDRQDNGKRKVQTMIYKTLHIKLKIK